MDGLLQDFRYSLRRLGAAPGFTLVAVLSLALGIGANTAIFSVVNAILIREYPFEQPDRLVRLYTDVEGRAPYGSVNYVDFQDLRRLSDVFEDVGAFDTFFSAAERNGQVQRVNGEAVTHNLFPLLGVDAALGRTFLPEEDAAPGGHPVVLLGHGFWENELGGDPEVLGKTLRLLGRPYTIVGVMPRRFESLAAPGMSTDVFVPATMAALAAGDPSTSRYETRSSRNFSVVGRLAEGVTMQAAQARMDGLSRILREAFPEAGERRSYSMVPETRVALTPAIDRGLRSIAVLMMAVVGMVLLLACTNLAGFLLARGLDRKREIALRLAIGATRGALVRQLLIETLALAFLGGTLGLVVGYWTLGLVESIHPPFPVTFSVEGGLDRNALIFTFGAAVLAGLAVGLVPALQSTRPDVAQTLKGAVPSGRRRAGLRGGLVAFQVAIAVVLLTGGALFTRSLGAARTIDPGFDVDGTAVLWIDYSISGIESSEFRRTTEQLTRRARALPGVDAVTAAGSLPLFLHSSSQNYRIPGLDDPESDGRRVLRHAVDPSYFATLGIPLLRGRPFSDQDRPGSNPVAIVSDAAARAFWPGQNAVGREFVSARYGTRFEVVGVAADTKTRSLGEAPTPVFYTPLAQASQRQIFLVARSGSDPRSTLALLHRMVREVAPELVVVEAKTLADQIGVVLFPARMAALGAGILSILALALAALGLYGLVSFAVSRRTREMGIRMSLGADQQRVVRTLMAGGMKLVAIGGIIGIGVGLGFGQLVRGFLYGIGPVDPVVLVGVPLFLALVSGVAAYVPASRASRVDPVEALRME